MGLFEHFPYSNYHDINLDRILERTKAAETAIAATQAALDAALGDMADAAADAAAALLAAQNAVNTANTANNTANTANGHALNAQQVANKAMPKIYHVSVDTLAETWMISDIIVIEELEEDLKNGTAILEFPGGDLGALNDEGLRCFPNVKLDANDDVDTVTGACDLVKLSLGNLTAFKVAFTGSIDTNLHGSYHSNAL